MRYDIDQYNIQLSKKCFEDDLRFRLTSNQDTDLICPRCHSKPNFPVMISYKVTKLNYIDINTRCMQCNNSINEHLDQTFTLLYLHRLRKKIIRSKVYRIITSLLTLVIFIALMIVIFNVQIVYQKFLVTILLCFSIAPSIIVHSIYYERHVKENIILNQTKDFAGNIELKGEDNELT